jgi:hypothetical protein
LLLALAVLVSFDSVYPISAASQSGVCLVTSFAQAKEVTRQQAKKGLSKSEKISVNRIQYN